MWKVTSGSGRWASTFFAETGAWAVMGATIHLLSIVSMPICEPPRDNPRVRKADPSPTRLHGPGRRWALRVGLLLASLGALELLGALIARFDPVAIAHRHE